MKRFLACLMLAAVAQPAFARDAEPPYYGPMNRWHGSGFKTGYNDRTEKDGTWRIDAATHGGGDAIDMALYRAAERASEQGYRFVFLLGGTGRKSPGLDMATVYASPSKDAVPPIGCRSKKVTTCYTADVQEVMRILGGPGGKQPGVAIVDHRDEYGREVRFSGYGTGGVVTLVPGAKVGSRVSTITSGKVQVRSGTQSELAQLPAASSTPAVSPATPMPVPPAPLPLPGAAPATPVVMMADLSGSTRIDTMERFEEARAAVKPIRGGSPAQGWKITE